jgi:hypothetical protein
MSWLDKLLGREKKKSSEETGESSMPSEGMRQAPEPEPMAPEGTGPADQPPQEQQEQPPGTP